VNRLGRFALVGNSFPRRFGIATFTTDLQQSIENLPAHERCSIVAMTDDGHAPTTTRPPWAFRSMIKGSRTTGVQPIY